VRPTCARVARGRRPLAARAARAPGPDPAGGLLRLPVLPCGVALPTCSGAVLVFEPAWSEALDAALAASLASGKVRRGRGRGAPWRQPAQRRAPQPPRFIHCAPPAAAPPALLAPHGHPRAACLAVVRGVDARAGGGRMVRYALTRRVALLGVDLGPAGSTTATAAYFDDAPLTADAATRVAALEVELADALAAVARLTEGGARLPPAVADYAPPRSPPPSRAAATSAGLRAGGQRAAAAAVDVWARQRAPTSRAPLPAPGPTRFPAAPPGRLAQPGADPYSRAAASTGVGGRRAELFSFACATALDLPPNAALALLLSDDTEGRLQFVLEAVREHVAGLAARAALRGLNGGGG